MYRIMILYIMVLVGFIPVTAQMVSLRGTVTNTSGQGIPNAAVRLVNEGLQAITNAQGQYVINKGVSTLPFTKWDPEIFFKNGQLHFKLSRIEKVSFVIKDLKGREWAQWKLEVENQVSISLPKLKTSGFYTLTVKIRSKEFTIRFFVLPGGQKVFSKQDEFSFSQKRDGLKKKPRLMADQLAVSAGGYNSRDVAVIDLIDTIDIALTQNFVGKKPNILFLYSDQHQAAAMGYEGHPDVMTPNFDKLAKGGVNFTRAYVQDAVCAPSHQSLMTGLFPRTIGVLDNGDKTTLLRTANTMAETFQSNGYVTATFGKRHLDEADKGWDIHVSHRDSEDKGASYVQWLIDEGINPKSGRPYIQDFAEDWAAEFGSGPPGGGQYGTTFTFERGPLATRTTKLDAAHTMEGFTTSKSIDFIKNRDKSKPFFLWSTFYRPHQPYNPLPEYLKMYNDQVNGWINDWGTGLKNNGRIKKPANLEQPKQDLPPMLRGWRSNVNFPWNLGTAEINHQIYRDYIGAYYALITEVDKNVGDIIKALEDEGILENTIILYSADHGEFAGRHGMVEKAQQGHSMYDDTYRVPFLWSWPGYILPDQKPNSLAEVVDVFPTLLEFAGITFNAAGGQPLQGKSLVPSLTSGVPTGKDYVVTENWSSITIISESHKLTKWFSGNSLRPGKRDDSQFGNALFDRRFDSGESPAQPLETENLYGRVEMNSVQTDLESKLTLWLDSISSIGRDELFPP